MPRLFEAAINFFKADEWPFTQVEGRPVLRLGFEGDNGRWFCYADAREKQNLFLFYSVCPVNTPAEMRPAMAEFLTRANFDLPIGNFEMDFEDGEIRYKTSIDAEDDLLSDALIRNLVYANIYTMDRYLPGIMNVLNGDASPPEAIAQIEGNGQQLRSLP